MVDLVALNTPRIPIFITCANLSESTPAHPTRPIPPISLALIVEALCVDLVALFVARVCHESRILP